MNINDSNKRMDKIHIKSKLHISLMRRQFVIANDKYCTIITKDYSNAISISLKEIKT